LHDGDIEFATGFVDRRGDHHEGVVDVDEIGLFPLEKSPNIAFAVARMNDVLDQEQLARSGYLLEFMIAAEVGDHLMSTFSEQTAFGSDDDIFAAGTLVGIVNEDDFHT
jgi:hypothetical protein